MRELNVYERLHEKLNSKDKEQEYKDYQEKFDVRKTRVIKQPMPTIGEIVDEKIWLKDKGYIELMRTSYYVVTSWHANMSSDDLRRYGGNDTVRENLTKKVKYCINDICKVVSSGIEIKIIHNKDVIKVYETVERYLRLKYGADYDSEVRYSIASDMTDAYEELINLLTKRYKYAKEKEKREREMEIEEINELLTEKNTDTGFNLIVNPFEKKVTKKKKTKLKVRRGKYGKII